VDWLAPSADPGCAAAATLTVKERRGTDISGVAQHRRLVTLRICSWADLQSRPTANSHCRVGGIFAELACSPISEEGGAVSYCDAGCRHFRMACVSAESRLEAFGAMPIPAD
jgi:hypothetical protein